MSEIALVKSRKVRLRELSKKGKKGAKYALHLIRHPNRFLSTIQIGISLMGILSGVYGGAVIAAHLDLVLRKIPSLAGYSMTLSYVLVVTVITYLLLVMGELIPKRVAMFNPEMAASLVSIPMVFLSRMAAPAVYILSLSRDGLLKILGVEKYKEPPPSEDEIRYLFRQGARNETLEHSEVRLVERVLNLDDQSVGSIMTRLPDISVFRKTDSFEEMLQTAEKKQSHLLSAGGKRSDRDPGRYSGKGSSDPGRGGNPRSGKNYQACRVRETICQYTGYSGPVQGFPVPHDPGYR